MLTRSSHDIGSLFATQFGFGFLQRRHHLGTRSGYLPNVEANRRQGFSKSANNALEKASVLDFHAGWPRIDWWHCACLVPPKELAGVGYICQSCLPDSRDRFDCLPLGPVASQAVQGPAGLAESLPKKIL